MNEGSLATYAIDPPTGARLQHYVAAMILVGGVFALGVLPLNRMATPDVLSETQDAVLIDLPPVEAGTRPPGDETPTQQATPPTTTEMPPQRKPDEIDPPKPSTADNKEMKPQAPSFAAILDTPTQPPRQTAPEAAAQEAHEAGSPETAQANVTDADGTETHRASAHQIALWQKALMARLQAARHGLPPHERASGIVKVAFEIDRDGHLVSERIAKGSGSHALDVAALALVQRAAPYPSPPHDAGASQLSFVVPISFKR
jgi:TonB family C-terminal domain